MVKVRMQIELGVEPRLSSKLIDLSNLENQILTTLLDGLDSKQSNWIGVSIKISNVENKKHGVFWKKLK